VDVSSTDRSLNDQHPLSFESEFPLINDHEEEHFAQSQPQEEEEPRDIGFNLRMNEPIAKRRETPYWLTVLANPSKSSQRFADELFSLTTFQLACFSFSMFVLWLYMFYEAYIV